MTEAWVTLATTDAYALGALVLAQSLKRVKTTRKTHCIITTGVSQGMREHLHAQFDAISTVDVLDSRDAENLALIERPDLGVTFTKLHCWRLTQYDKAVFLDADTMFLKNADELFAERDEFSAAPDIGWPDMFNSGVFVFQPSLDTYRELQKTALQTGSFDGGDQGLLNTYFNTWRESDARYRLPFIYNMSSSAVYTYAAAYKHFGPQVKIVHFLGALKPWHYAFNQEQGTVHLPNGQSIPTEGKSAYASSHLQLWWHLFTNDLQPLLKPQYRAPLPTCPHVMNPHHRPAEPDVSSVKPEPEPVQEEPVVKDADSDKENDSVKEEIKEVKDVKEDTKPVRLPHQPRDPPVAPKVRKVYRIRIIRKPERRPASHRQPVNSNNNRNGTQQQHPFTNSSNISKTVATASEPCPPPPPKPQQQQPVQPDQHDVSSGPSADVSLTGGYVGPSTAGGATAGGAAEHQRAWEAGVIDYTGRDSWENIQKRLDASLAKAPEQAKTASLGGPPGKQ